MTSPHKHDDVIDFDDDETEIHEDESDEEDQYENTDLTTLLAQFFIEPKKQRNITEVLCDIKKQMEIQNKLLAQIYMSLSSKA
jgi:hypothetical protein